MAQFTAALSQACIALRLYGKTPAELRAMREMFLAVLADVPVRKITSALFVHLNRSNEIPTPKQLRDIIEPPTPPLSAAAYVSLKKRIAEGYYPLSDEKAFLRAFEEQEYAKARGCSDDPRLTQGEIQPHRPALQLGHSDE